MTSSHGHPTPLFDRLVDSVLAAITLLTGSTLAQIPEMSDADWMAYNRTLQGDRYSPLKEITTANVQYLKPRSYLRYRREGQF